MLIAIGRPGLASAAATTLSPVKRAGDEEHPSEGVESPVVDVAAFEGEGPVWGTASEDLNATLLVWPAGDGTPSHVNDERDVLVVVLAGSATVTIDDRGRNSSGAGSPDREGPRASDHSPHRRGPLPLGPSPPRAPPDLPSPSAHALLRWRGLTRRLLGASRVPATRSLLARRRSD